MLVIAQPVLPGKLEVWREWMASLVGEEFEDFNNRHNLTEHRAWLQSAPDGSHLVLVLIAGPGADVYVKNLGQSSHPFDVGFRGKVKEVHGMDVTQPLPGPMPELVLDYSGR